MNHSSRWSGLIPRSNFPIGPRLSLSILRYQNHLRTRIREYCRDLLMERGLSLSRFDLLFTVQRDELRVSFVGFKSAASLPCSKLLATECLHDQLCFFPSKAVEIAYKARQQGGSYCTSCTLRVRPVQDTSPRHLAAYVFNRSVCESCAKER